MTEVSKREKILEAAKELFVQHGFSGTSIGKISKRSGVTHSLIFHHFGTKENLWVEVKQAISQQMEQQAPLVPPLDLPFEPFLKTFITNCIHYYRRSPELIRMLNWQRLEQGHAKNISITLSRGMKTWMAAFEHYQQTGDIKPNLKLEYIVSFFAAIVSSAGLDRNVFIEESSELGAYIEFCQKTLLSGLAN